MSTEMDTAWHSLSRLMMCGPHGMPEQTHLDQINETGGELDLFFYISIFINFFDVNIQCTQIPPRVQIYFAQHRSRHPLTLLPCMVSFCQLLSHGSMILLSLVVALCKIWWVCRHQFCWLQGIVMWVSLHVLIFPKRGIFFSKLIF